MQVSPPYSPLRDTGSGTAGSDDSAIFPRDFHTVFLSSYAILHSQPQFTNVPIFTHACQHMLFSALSVMAMRGRRGDHHE